MHLIYNPYNIIYKGYGVLPEMKCLPFYIKIFV